MSDVIDCDGEFEILISKADFKFNCAHFIAFRGFRERLHGHNYQLGVRLIGQAGGPLGDDGYLMDFGSIKSVVRGICKSFNERFICPTKSDVVTLTETNQEVCLTCEDGSRFIFPIHDCIMLPMYHSSAEEMSHYIYFAILKKIGIDEFLSRGVHTMEVTVAEAPQQQGTFRCRIPRDQATMERLENCRVRKPSPCHAGNHEDSV